MANKNLFPSRTVEITVLSGESLRIDRKPVKKTAFVVVRSSTDANNFRTTSMVAGAWGSCRNWNEKLVLDLPAHAPAVIVEVHCKTAFGNRAVGAATVPVSDFSGGGVPESFSHFLSYRLRDCKGEGNGIINISVRTKMPVTAPEPAPVGFPVEKTDNSNLGGVVTGVPVW